MSDDIEQTAKNRNSTLSYYNQRLRSYKKELRKYESLVSSISKLETEISSLEYDIRNGKDYLERKLNKKISSLQSKKQSLSNKSKPVEPKPPLTSFAKHLASIYNDFSKPLLAISEIPCAQGTLTGERNYRFILEAGETRKNLNPIALWSSAGGGGSNYLSVYPKEKFDTPLPEIENVMIWSNNGEIELAGRTGKDKLVLSRDWITDSSDGLMYVIEGKNLCGDAKLEVRADQHNGMEGVPHNFDEGLLPNSFSEKPNSERRVFQIHNLSEATHALKSRLIFRRDIVRTLPGSDLALPTIFFKVSFFQVRWLFGFVLTTLALGISIFGLKLFSKKYDISSSKTTFEDQESSSDSNDQPSSEQAPEKEEAIEEPQGESLEGNQEESTLEEEEAEEPVASQDDSPDEKQSSNDDDT